MPCPPPYFPTVTHTGSVANSTQRFAYVPLPNFPVSFNCQTDNNIGLTLYAPDGVTVLADNVVSQDTLGVDTGAGAAAEIQYTFPTAQTYFIDVTGNGAFILDISPGAFGYTYATDSATYNAIYVPQTERIFILSAVDIGSFTPYTSNMVCINSRTMTNINTVQLSPPLFSPFIRVSNVLFYNPHDNSVWCFERDANTGTTTFLDRFNPVTGALIEHAAWGLGTSIPGIGSYSPHDNMVYGYSGNLSTSVLLVFDCNSRTFLSSIPLPAVSPNEPGGYAYDPMTGITYLVVESAHNVFRSVWTLFNGAKTSALAMTADMDIHSSKLLFFNGLIYGTDSQRRFKVLDPSTGIVTNLFSLFNGSGQYRIDMLAYDACRNCLALGLSGSNIVTDFGSASLAFGARFQTNGTIIEAALAQLLHGFDNFFWNNLLWNPEMNRLVVITDTGIFWF